MSFYNQKIFYVLCCITILLAACNSQTKELCDKYDDTCFNSVISKTRFISGTSVVWYPELPLIGDEISILYDTKSEYSRFTANDNIFLNYVPYVGVPDLKVIRMQKGQDGIYYLKADSGAFKARGRIFFSSENKTYDGNAGSNWKLAIVESLPEYMTYESAYCNYHYLKDDVETSKNIKMIISDFDKKIKVIENATGLLFKNKFDYYFYREQELLQKYHAHQNSNYDDLRRIVYSSGWHADMHEVTHLLFHQIGKNVGLISEGLAIHFGQELVYDGWNGHNCNWWAIKLKKENMLPELKNILTPTEFYQHDWTTVVGKIHYPVACSFVNFLINQYGLSKIKKLYSALNANNQDDINQVDGLFIEVYNKDVNKLDKEWKNKLDSL